MVGACAAVFGWAAAELGKGGGEDLVVFFMGDEIGLEGVHGLGEFLEEFCVAGELVCVGVVAGVGEVVDAGLEVCVDECGDAF